MPRRRIGRATLPKPVGGGPKNTDAAKAYYQQAAALGNEDAKAALECMKCPHVVKDKRGKVVSTVASDKRIADGLIRM